MSLSKTFAGRKRGSHVWTHFKHNESENNTKCIVIGAKGAACNETVATKNPTNLKNHLRTHHKEVYEEVLQKDKEMNDVKSVCKRRKVEGKQNKYSLSLFVKERLP